MIRRRIVLGKVMRIYYEYVTTLSRKKEQTVNIVEDCCAWGTSHVLAECLVECVRLALRK